MPSISSSVRVAHPRACSRCRPRASTTVASALSTWIAAPTLLSMVAVEDDPHVPVGVQRTCPVEVPLRT